MEKDIIYNYMSISKGGEVEGIFALEKGTVNEMIIVEKALELGYDIKKSSEEEFNTFGEKHGVETLGKN